MTFIFFINKANSKDKIDYDIKKKIDSIVSNINNNIKNHEYDVYIRLNKRYCEDQFFNQVYFYYENQLLKKISVYSAQPSDEIKFYHYYFDKELIKIEVQTILQYPDNHPEDYPNKIGIPEIFFAKRNKNNFNLKPHLLDSAQYYLKSKEIFSATSNFANNKIQSLVSPLEDFIYLNKILKNSKTKYSILKFKKNEVRKELALTGKEKRITFEYQGKDNISLKIIGHYVKGDIYGNEIASMNAESKKISFNINPNKLKIITLLLESSGSSPFLLKIYIEGKKIKLN
ncbi:MAG: hypothetical protein GY830_05685 [Bacteroidetes bacterium]|nr:hypothetical protein [Bacteroidota bacterium]